MKYKLLIRPLAFIVISTIIVSLLYYRLPMNQSIKIGTTYMTMNNTFYKAINDEIKKEVVSKNDILVTKDPLLDSEKQVEQIYDFIDMAIDVLIINPVNGNDNKTIQALKKAKSQGIRVILIDTLLKDTSSVDCTIISDNYNAGVLCAKHLMSTKEKASILLIEHQEALSAVDRIKGFTDTIKNNDNYRIISRVDGSGQTELVMPKVEKVIHSKVYFDTIMALNDPSALGAMAAIESTKLNRNIAVYGVDGSPDMKKLIKDSNNQYYTSAQFPLKMARMAVKNAYRFLEYKKVASKETVEVELVHKDNVDQYTITGWQ